MTGTETPTLLHKVKPLKLTYFWDIKHNDTQGKPIIETISSGRKRWTLRRQEQYIYIYIYIYIIYTHITDIYLDVIIVVTQ